MVLGIFKRKGTEPTKILKAPPKNEIKKIEEKPKIILIDLESDITKKLQEKGLNATEGSLGERIHVPNTLSKEVHPCLLNYNIPDNLHEYQVVILNLQDSEVIEYDPKNHLRDNISSDSQIFFTCQYPQTIFDPKPICGNWFLLPHLNEILKKEGILIVFSNSHYTQKYQLVRITNRGAIPDEQHSFSNYHFTHLIPNSSNKYGKEMIVEEKTAFTPLLKRFLPESTYDIVFPFPTIYIQESREYIPDSNFFPLIRNVQNEIVSFIRFSDKGAILLFPNIKDKSSFLVELLTEVLPSIFPEIFPNYSKYKWLQDPDYQLLKESDLIQRKNAIIKTYEENIDKINQEIERNYQKYSCLHSILTETNNNLVNAVKMYLEWLGFSQVRKIDLERTRILEEDLQFEYNGTIILVEVKGIGRTSKDEECSQIDKIVLRRIRETGNTAIHGVYIVNHQKHLPPLDRQNPPFTSDQISDAVDNSRGLITTWQLFNLYFSIKNGAIIKEEARTTFLKIGLIEFIPNNILPLGKPKNVLKNGEVILLILTTIIRKNGVLFIKRDDRFYLVKICEIQIDDKIVDSADSCGVGIKIDMVAKNTDEIYYRDSA